MKTTTLFYLLFSQLNQSLVLSFSFLSPSTRTTTNKCINPNSIGCEFEERDLNSVYNDHVDASVGEKLSSRRDVMRNFVIATAAAASAFGGEMKDAKALVSSVFCL